MAEELSSNRAKKESAGCPLKKESAGCSNSVCQKDEEDPVNPLRVHQTVPPLAFHAVFQSWVSKKFMTGCVVLFLAAVTFFVTWWFIQFVDGFFSPIYERLGIDIFDQNTTAFKEVAIICHPRVGEYAMGFITSSVVLQTDDADEEKCSVYVPTNHLYIGYIFLVNFEIIRPNLSVREGIEIIVS